MLCAPAALGALEQPGVRAFQDIRPLVLGEQGPFSGGIQVTQGTQCTQNKRFFFLRFSRMQYTRIHAAKTLHQALLRAPRQRPTTFFYSEMERNGTKVFRSLSNRIHSVPFRLKKFNMRLILFRSISFCSNSFRSVSTNIGYVPFRSVQFQFL